MTQGTNLWKKGFFISLWLAQWNNALCPLSLHGPASDWGWAGGEAFRFPKTHICSECYAKKSQLTVLPSACLFRGHSLAHIELFCCLNC